MNISNLFNFGASSAWGNASPSAKSVQDVSPLTLAVQRADKRVQTEVDSNTAQLSSFGKLKSYVSEVQRTAQALTQLPATATGTDLKTALAKLVSAFNAATDIASTTAALPGASAASLSASRVSKDLQTALSGDPSLSGALEKIGVSVQNGSLALNDTPLDAALAADPAAVQATLTQLAGQMNHTATTELQADGNVSGSLTTLNQQARVLEAQQSALQSATQATATPGSARGLSAYQAHMNRH